MVRFINDSADALAVAIATLHSNMVRFIIFIQEQYYDNTGALHSNMVRFIIINNKYNKAQNELYIPIWLDLLGKEK